MLHPLSMACTPCFWDGFGLVISWIPYSGTTFHFIHNGFPVSIFFRDEEIGSLTASVIVGDIVAERLHTQRRRPRYAAQGTLFSVPPVGKLAPYTAVLFAPVVVGQGAVVAKTLLMAKGKAQYLCQSYSGPFVIIIRCIYSIYSLLPTKVEHTLRLSRSRFFTGCKNSHEKVSGYGENLP